MPEPSLSGPLPPMRLLRVFEAAARHGNFSRAAAELLTTQSSVSRAVTELERLLGGRLFERLHRGVRLTAVGELYREAVGSGLGRIATMGAMLGSMPDEHIVVACAHATAALFIAPLREDLYQAVGGGGTHVHILTCDYDLLARLNPNDADVVLTYDADGVAAGDRAVAFREAVTPVCAPAYAARHADTLARPVEHWGTMTFLYLERASRGWATWEDWFEAAGRPSPEPRYRGYWDYTFLIEDAVAGSGVALGWRRFVDRHLEAGALVAPGDGYMATDRVHWAALTERGRVRPLARRCLDFFDDMTRQADGA